MDKRGEELAMMRLLKWQDEEVATAKAWQAAQGHSGQALEAYEAGVRQGFGRALHLLRLHRAINIDRLA